MPTAEETNQTLTIKTFSDNALFRAVRLFFNKSVLIAWAVWTVLGLSFASESYLRKFKSGSPFPFWIFVVEFLTEFYLYALFSMLLFRLSKKFPLELKNSRKEFFKHIFIHLIASIIFSIVNVFLQALITVQWEGDLCKDCLTPNMLFDPHFLHRGIIIYWGIIIVGQGIEYFKGLNEEKLRVAQLSSQLSEAQLSALKMQIHPHFLFNTLNSIAELVQVNPDLAELMISKLADFLRLTLQSSSAPLITLKEEMNFLQTYLEIEKVRFQDRLSVKFLFDENIHQAKIPNLLLQPIVENSIKHGINKNKGLGFVIISARKENDRMIIDIEDSGKIQKSDADKKFKNGTGVGLKNVEARLKEIYGGDYFFEIKEIDNIGTKVGINIPYTN